MLTPAVNPVVWTSWKVNPRRTLSKTAMLEEKISGEELLYSASYAIPKEIISILATFLKKLSGSY
jgi:hypothetical protein